MQLIHVPCFINRVVYNACKAYVGQIKATEKFSTLTDVVAISICDFQHSHRRRWTPTRR